MGYRLVREDNAIEVPGGPYGRHGPVPSAATMDEDHPIQRAARDLGSLRHPDARVGFRSKWSTEYDPIRSALGHDAVAYGFRETHPTLGQFVHGSRGHVDGGLHVSTRSRVAIGNGDAAKGLSPCSCGISRAANRVTVGPPIDRDALDISVELE